MGNGEYIMLHHHHRTVAGFSIIEILVGMALSSLLAFAAYDMLTLQQKTRAAHDDVLEMQQNLRIAMGRISSDLTMAGFGKPSHLGRSAWLQLNSEGAGTITYSVQVTGGNTLDVVGCLGPAEGHAPAALGAGTTTITLAGGEGAHFNTTTKSDISIGGTENAKVVAVTGDVLTIDTNPALAGNQGLINGYASGMTLYTVTHVTYAINTTGSVPILTVDKHQGAGAQPVAQFIETMSVALNGNALVVSLTGRTRNPNRTTNQYVRIQTQDQVYLRNLPNITS
jgi:prepilin-type N-terminal cleavage/methylation domain-containing protein